MSAEYPQVEVTFNIDEECTSTDAHNAVVGKMREAGLSEFEIGVFVGAFSQAILEEDFAMFEFLSKWVTVHEIENEEA